MYFYAEVCRGSLACQTTAGLLSSKLFVYKWWTDLLTIITKTWHIYLYLLTFLFNQPGFWTDSRLGWYAKGNSWELLWQYFYMPDALLSSNQQWQVLLKNAARHWSQTYTDKRNTNQSPSRAALISVSLALSQTPVYTARSWIRG